MVKSDSPQGSGRSHRIEAIADQVIFRYDSLRFEEFQRLLDEPLPSTGKFEALFSRPSQFGQ
jgi:uncharacterized protein (DUF1778 family)